MPVFAPSTRAVRYVGASPLPIKFVKYYKGEDRIKVSSDDILILPAPQALRLSKKRNWEILTHDESREVLQGGNSPAPLNNITTIPDADLVAELHRRGLGDYTLALGAGGDDGVSGDGIDAIDAEGSTAGEPSNEDKPAEEAKAAEEAKVAVTRENVRTVDIADLKKILKNHSVRYGGKSRAELEALVVPFLEA